MALPVESLQLLQVHETNKEVESIEVAARKEREYEKACEKWSNILPTLNREKGWLDDDMVQYQGTWLSPLLTLRSILLMHDLFTARPDDVLLVTSPKAGTTWFKALIFAIMNRSRFSLSSHPLLNNGPHHCVPSIEVLYHNKNQALELDTAPTPRILATHMPYPLLPKTTKSSECKIVYVYRDPKAVFVSQWHFFMQLREKHSLPLIPFHDAVNMFCTGLTEFGPFWDHVLGYWKVSKESPTKVFFMKYEDTKKNPLDSVKKLAEFLGHPFTEGEEKSGAVEEIVKLCSFETLVNLEVNREGILQVTPQYGVQNRYFFRKGEARDWENHLSEEIVKRFDEISEQKFGPIGLNF
ncbi:Sulfotransferase domain [Dillenia turbinata]|uniref:Sulfotransferase n=1 Tax=Dillenia turbinata TaxID=194707 RepID=A0AAN8VVH8_9MAGN